MANRFSKKTFDFLTAANKNRKSRKWFEDHKDDYDEHIKEPMAALIRKVDQAVGKKLPGIKLDPKKITRPLYASNRVPMDGSVIKLSSGFFFTQKQTSRFEWNPGLYFSLAHDKDENMFGMGCYMVSSRQMNLIRKEIATNHAAVKRMLTGKKFVEHWDGLAGETYTRFPRGYSEDQPGAEYLWHKQFYIGRHLTKTEICRANFFDCIAQDAKAGMPFLTWLRETVGTYR